MKKMTFEGLSEEVKTMEGSSGMQGHVKEDSTAHHDVESISTKEKKIEQVILLIMEQKTCDSVDDLEDIDLISFPVYLRLCCSEEQIDSLIHYLSSANKFDLFSTPKKLGIAECYPILYKNSLILGASNYLHWFRGYYFQVSCTHTGIYSNHVSNSRLDFAMSYEVNSAIREKYVNMLFSASALIPAYKCNDNFHKFIETEEGRKVFNSFLNAARVYDARINYSVDVCNLLDSITVKEYSEDLTLDVESESTMNVQLIKGNVIQNKNIPIAVLSLSANFIRIIWKNKVNSNYVSKTLQLPENLFSADNILDNSESAYTSAYLMLLEFMLVYCGFRFSPNIYVLPREKDIKSNDLKFPTFKNINDFTTLVEEVRLFIATLENI